MRSVDPLLKGHLWSSISLVVIWSNFSMSGCQFDLFCACMCKQETKHYSTDLQEAVTHQLYNNVSTKGVKMKIE